MKYRSLRILLLVTAPWLAAASLRAEKPAYLSDIRQWKEAKIPSESPRPEHVIWFYAANYSPFDWHVSLDGEKLTATLIDRKTNHPKSQPGFVPEADNFHGDFSAAKVDDGWLIGFNNGEFGAALFWFSNDGTHNYRISDHQIVDFFSLSDGSYAIEGLAHMSLSQGSVIRIVRPEATAHWQVVTVVKLPFAPYAVSTRKDDTILITLSDAIVAIGPDRKIRTLLADAPWKGFYPNSSILSPDQRYLYIGMRQFIGEFDLVTNKLRFLIPSQEFINKLPEKEEARMRKQFAD